MSAITKTRTSRTHLREPSFVSGLSGWAQQGVQNFLATPRSLLDLASGMGPRRMPRPTCCRVA
jgi:hypothetical protein